MEKYIDFSSDQISLIGRTAIYEASLGLCWPGSGFRFCFSGTELRIHFGEFKGDRHFYFKISIDNKISQVHCVCATDQIVIIRGLTEGNHCIKVIKITESQNSAIVKKIVVCGENPSFSKEDSSPFLKFEFIGDSLTAGFGNLSEPDAGIYRASEQDITYGYSYLTAKEMKAEGRYICFSGKGIFNNWDGSKENLIPDFYKKVVLDSNDEYNFLSWRPDMIFINAGTNDITANTNPEDFKKAYFDFVLKVNSVNPSSTIICIHGMTTDKFSEAFAQLEDELKKHFSKTGVRIVFIKFNPISPELYGALGHPNSNAHAHFAREVIKAIKKIPQGR